MKPRERRGGSTPGLRKNSGIREMLNCTAARKKGKKKKKKVQNFCL